MTGVRADYDSKRQAILDAAAVLFAREGYANVNMADIAKAWGGAKSSLYHYFPKKEDVLFEIMKEQVQSYLEATEAVIALPSPPEDRLREFVTMWIRKSAEARARITVLMYEYKFLSKRQRSVVGNVARTLIQRVSDLVAQVNPAVTQASPPRHRTYTLLLFGLLNWTEVWYRSTGPLGPDEMADTIFGLFLGGLRSGVPVAAMRSARP